MYTVLFLFQMPDGLDETSTISIVDKDSEYILGGNSEFQAEITYGDKDNVASANTDQAIIFSKPISQNVSIYYDRHVANIEYLKLTQKEENSSN